MRQACKHLAMKAVRCLVLEFRVFFFFFFFGHSATMMSRCYPTLLSALNISNPPCDANISYCLILMIFCAYISRRDAFTGVKQSEVCVLLCSGDSHGGRLTTLTGRPGLREFPSQCACTCLMHWLFRDSSLAISGHQLRKLYLKSELLSIIINIIKQVWTSYIETKQIEFLEGYLRSILLKKFY